MQIRRWVQGASFVGLNTAYAMSAKVLWFCPPVLNCHACPTAWFVCPIGIFMHFAGWLLLPLIALGTVLVSGVVFGRLFCGWICPFGTLQALLYRIPSPKIRLPQWMGYVKYVVLILTVFAFPLLLGEETMLAFCRWCPAATVGAIGYPWAWQSIAGFTGLPTPEILSAPVSWSGVETAGKVLVLALVVVFAIVASRSFCKVLCPIGALLGPLNHVAFWRVRPPTDSCIQCGKCDRTCTTDVSPQRRILKGESPTFHHDCISCHECQPVCPVKSNKDSDA